MPYATHYLLFLLLFACTSCGDTPADDGTLDPDLPETETAIENELTPANMAPEFAEVLEAHGGLPIWNDARGISFLVRDFPTGNGDQTITDYHRVDLGSRYQQIEGDNYEIVTRGDSTWVSPDATVTGIPPRMYQGATFYLMGMPFVFADEGLTITYAGEVQFGDETVDQFNVQVPDNLGDGGNDYQLYADTATHQLQYGTWSVSYPAVADMNLRQMVEFEEWQSVEGLILPATIKLYTAPNEIEPGTPGATIGFERVALSDQPFDDVIFTTPEDGVLDESAY